MVFMKRELFSYIGLPLVVVFLGAVVQLLRPDFLSPSNLARLSGFGGCFNQNPCNFQARVPKVFTTRVVLALGSRRSHGVAADWVTKTATALTTFGVPVRAACTGT